MTIANYFTLIRILMSPLFLIVYWQSQLFGINLTLLPFVLLSFLIISEGSDAIDGYLARKYNQVTDLGKILDPMADSMYRLSVFLTFTLPPVQLPMVLVFALLYRDSVVSTLRTICALKGVALAARLSGKIKAVVQAVAALLIILLLIPYSHGYISLDTLQLTSACALGVAAVYTLYSGFDYIYANRDHVLKLLTFKPSYSIKNEQKI